MNGLKGTHHLPAELDHGRWTLFPQLLVKLLPERDGDWLSLAAREALGDPERSAIGAWRALVDDHAAARAPGPAQ